MTDITITILTAQTTRVVNAFCDAYGWTPDDGGKGAFAKAKLAEHIRNTVLGQERAAAEAAAVAAVTVEDVTLS